MKKFALIIGVLFALIIGALIILPIVFKDRILQEVKVVINQQVNAKVNFDDVSMSLISSFPNFRFELLGTHVVNTQEPFTDVELAKIGTIAFELDLMSVINGESISIQSIELNDVYANVIVTKEGLANYDIAKPSTTEQEVAEEETTTTDSHLSLGIEQYSLKNINVNYSDYSADLFTEVVNLNHSGSGDFTLTEFNLLTKTSIESIVFESEGAKYLNKANIEYNAGFGINQETSTYTLLENTFRINALELQFNGVVAMPTDSIEVDLTFGSNQNSFASILSMVPAVYLTDFETIKTSGDFAFNGSAKGVYFEDLLPAFDFNLLVKNGMFQYPDLPKSCNNINIDLQIVNNGNLANDVAVNLKQFAMNLGENPISANLFANNLMVDPYFELNTVAKINLADFAEVMPTENGEEYGGTISADVHAKGNLSTLENEQYDQFYTEGKIIALDVLYKDPSYLTYDVLVKSAYTDFTSEALKITNCDIQLGESDLAITGELTNYIAYSMFDNQVLGGTINLSSNYLNIDQLMSEPESASTEATPADTLIEEEPTEIPAEYNLGISSNIQKIKYDTYLIENLTGDVVVANQTADMHNVIMDFLGGQVGLDGQFETKNPLAPTTNMNLNLTQVDVQELAENFNSVKVLAPVVEGTKGKISTRFKLSTTLNKDWEPIYESLNAFGNLKTHNVKIEQSGVLTKIAEIAKKPDYSQLELTNANLTFEVINGTVFVNPFSVKNKDRIINIVGKNSLDLALDYDLQFDVPTEDFGGSATSLAANLISEANKNGAQFSMTNRTKIDFIVTGTVLKPEIKPVLGGISSKDDAIDLLKNKAKEELEKQKAELEAKAKAEADRLKAEAEAKAKAEADKLKAKAQAEADSLKKVAEDKAKAEADKLKDQAKETIKGLFNKGK